jgi:predicted transcriptional regulator
MKTDRALFDTTDDEAEQRANARAEASVRAGRLISHDAVKRWLGSWGSAKRLPRPRVGD